MGVIEDILFNETGTPAHWDNPHPHYRALREREPYYWSSAGAWVLTRYRDCMAMMRHPLASSEPANADANAAVENSGVDLFTQISSELMLFRDPPDHTRLRGLVSQAFSPRTIELFRPRVEAIVAELLDGLAARGGGDLIEEFAYPLPVRVICELLGVPPDQQAQFTAWSRDLSRTIDPTINEETMGRIAMSGLQFIQYFNNLIGERRADPREDLLSALIAAEAEGDRLSHTELLANCILLFIAGHETTVNLIGNGTYTLLAHPDQLERLRSDPEGLARPAVEELLRYESPVHLTARIALGDIDLDGHTIGKGQQAMTLLAAANRDPAQFHDPDRLDITRADNKPLAFGIGIHFCLGAALARLEGQVAIPSLVTRFPNLELTREPAWRDSVTLRGLSSLSVKV